MRRPPPLVPSLSVLAARQIRCASRLGFAVLMAQLAACGGLAADADESAAPPQLSYPSPAASDAILDGLARLNSYRAAAGVPVTALDGATSGGCLRHLQYLEAAAQITNGGGCLLDHAEPDHGNPYYSPDSEHAGKGALMACVPPSQGGLHSWKAIDRWMDSLYHRIPILAPGLQRVGLAEHGGYVCLHFRDGTTEAKAQLVVWPPDGIVDVPTMFVGRESPCPTAPSDPYGTPPEQCPGSGYIMTATWYGPSSVGFSEVSSVEARLEATSQPVPLLAWYADTIPEHDPEPGLVPRTVAIAPASALASNMRVRGDVKAVIDGSPVTASWGFRTGFRSE